MISNISVAKTNFPSSGILGNPIVEELSKALKMPDFEYPFKLPNKVLMDEGTWNNHFFSAESIAAALTNTDWSDRNKRDLFYEHEDTLASEWIGEIINPRMEGKKLFGDLVIHDWGVAMKLQSGKPKFGISPKVKGKQNIKTNEMVDFVFDNFSLVYNPAVKTAYINNSSNDISTGEKLIKIESGSKISKDGGLRMSEEEKKTEAEVVPEEKKEEPEAEEKPAAEEAPVEKEEEKPEEDKADELSEVEGKISTLKALLGELEKKKSIMAPVSETKELSKKLSAIEKKLSSVERLVAIKETPDRRSINVQASSGREEAIAKLNEMKKDTNQAMYDFLIKTIDGGARA